MESQDILVVAMDNLEEAVAVDGLFWRGLAFAFALSLPVFAAVIVAWRLLT